MKKGYGSKKQIGENKWQLTISLGVGYDGKQVKKSRIVTAKNEKEADKQLYLFYSEYQSLPNAVHDNISFFDFCKLWYNRYVSKLSPTTALRYKKILEDRILPAFGSIQLKKITGITIISFIDSISSEGMRLDGREGALSSRSLEIIYKLFKSILNKAVEWKFLACNPCNDIPREEIPRAKSKRREIWSIEELNFFFNSLYALPDTQRFVKYKLMATLAWTTGARRGEYTGIKWSDINFYNNTIDINKSLTDLPGKELFLKDPKTEESNRIVSFDDYTKHLFLLHKKLQDDYLYNNNLCNYDNFVFISTTRFDEQTRRTKPIYPDSFYNWFSRYVEQIGLPHITIHAFRHMACTYALMAGTPINLVQNMLGHANIKTTEGYIHRVQNKDNQFTQNLSEMIKNTRPSIEPEIKLVRPISFIQETVPETKLIRPISKINP